MQLSGPTYTSGVHVVQRVVAVCRLAHSLVCIQTTQRLMAFALVLLSWRRKTATPLSVVSFWWSRAGMEGFRCVFVKLQGHCSGGVCHGVMIKVGVVCYKRGIPHGDCVFARFAIFGESLVLIKKKPRTSGQIHYGVI